MMTNQTTGSVWRLLQWQRDSAYLFAGMGALAWFLHDVAGLTWVALPTIPVTIVGGAIGVFVSFRTNSAYDRWWEGRKLWGLLINSSRHFCDQVIAYLGDKDPELARALVLRHVAWVHTLRCLLRKQNPLDDAEALQWLDDTERELFPTTQTPTHLLIHRQQLAVTKAADGGLLTEHRLESFDRTLGKLLDIQGGCERIKGTPLPRGYAFITDTLVQYFSIVLPFAMVPTLGILTIPMNLLVCMAFMLISETGRVLEDPFTMFFNTLPLNNLSRKVEIDLRARLGDDDLPPPTMADPRGILW
jgi:putative membrane protein